jgi:hypothetical protein
MCLVHEPQEGHSHDGLVRIQRSAASQQIRPGRVVVYDHLSGLNSHPLGWKRITLRLTYMYATTAAERFAS